MAEHHLRSLEAHLGELSARAAPVERVSSLKQYALQGHMAAVWGAPSITVGLRSCTGNNNVLVSTLSYLQVERSLKNVSFIVRPQLCTAAPAMHIELSAPIGSFPGVFIFDLYNFSGANLDEFVAPIAAELAAIADVCSPYHREAQVAQITEFLKTRKTKYRIELQSPAGDAGTKQAQAFYALMHDVVSRLASLYLARLDAVTGTVDEVQHQRNFRTHLEYLLKYDSTIRMGHTLMGTDFMPWWLNFWGTPPGWFRGSRDDAPPMPVWACAKSSATEAATTTTSSSS